MIIIIIKRVRKNYSRPCEILVERKILVRTKEEHLGREMEYHHPPKSIIPTNMIQNNENDTMTMMIIIVKEEKENTLLLDAKIEMNEDDHHGQ